MYQSIIKKNKENLTVIYNRKKREKFTEYFKILHSKYNNKEIISKENTEKLEILRKEIHISEEDHQKNYNKLINDN